jgi:hypothetical protein
MDYLIATSALAALLILLAALGTVLGYNVDLTFHPPVFVRIRLTKPSNPPPAPARPVQRAPRRKRRASISRPSPPAPIERRADGE